jgi:two-component system response regulator (stage 0 sporulation protein F)
MAANQPRVLIVDDQPGIRRLLVEVLESRGYDVTVASNGYDGLQSVSDNNPDVILMDMKMPGMNGIEALREIGKKGHSGKVIMMTAYGEIEIINEIMAVGAHEYITKPFDINYLCRLIEEILSSQNEEVSEIVLTG